MEGIAVVASPFGLATNLAVNLALTPAQRNDALDLTREAGAGWIREEIRWDVVQPGAGPFQWEAIDTVVDAATNKGLQILGILNYNNSAITHQHSTDPPLPEPWKTYVSAVITRYKDRIHHWEVWNEPDVTRADGTFWLGTVQDYVDLLKATFGIIKNLDGAATVLNGRCSNMNLVFFNDMLLHGAGDFADVFALHPYVAAANLDGGPFQSDVLARIKAIQAKFNNKPVWFTEFGWTTAQIDLSDSGRFACVGSDQKQANYLVRQYVQLLHTPGLNVERAFLYALRNGGTDPNVPEHNYGLVQADLTPKPAAYFAYQQMTARLTGAVPETTFDSGAGTAYRFQRVGTTVDVLWGGGLAHLPTTVAAAHAFNMTGDPLPVAIVGGQIQVDVAADPIYVEHQ